MPVPLGFGVGDILQVGNLVRKIYKAYADAPEQFRNLSQDILSLNVVVRKVEDQLGISGSGQTEGASRLPDLENIPSLSAKDRGDLVILYAGLRTIMKELDDLLNKYQSLATNHQINRIDRLKWGKEDLVGLRDKLRSNITLLTSFNTSLVKCVLSLPTYTGCL